VSGKIYPSEPDGKFVLNSEQLISLSHAPYCTLYQISGISGTGVIYYLI